MTYTAIPDANIASGKPIREVDGLLLRDNPIAMMNGDSGAPRLQDAALDSTATNTGNTWVRSRTALSVVAQVGTYAFLQSDSQTDVGVTRSGSSLSFSSGSGDVSTITISGTWRCMGYCSVGATAAGVETTTLWLRIA